MLSFAALLHVVAFATALRFALAPLLVVCLPYLACFGLVLAPAFAALVVVVAVVLVAVFALGFATPFRRAGGGVVGVGGQFVRPPEAVFLYVLEGLG